MMPNSEARKRAAENDPSADVEALGDLVFYGDMDSAASMRSARIIAKHILASDWLAAHTAAAEARGAKYALLDAAEDADATDAERETEHPENREGAWWAEWLRARAAREAARNAGAS